MGWTFVYLMLILKIPIAALLWIVWWAIRSAPDWSIARENLGDLYARLAALEYAQAAKLDRDNKTAPAKLTFIRELLAKSAPAKPKS